MVLKGKKINKMMGKKRLNVRNGNFTNDKNNTSKWKKPQDRI